MLRYSRYLFSQKEGFLYLGLAFPLVWMQAISQNLVSGDFRYQALFHIGTLAGMLPLIVLFARDKRQKIPSSTDWLSAGLMCLVPLTSPASGILGFYVSCIFGFFGGVGIAWCYARWFQRYSTLPIRDAFAYIFLSFTVAYLLRSVLALAFEENSVIVIAILCLAPFASALFQKQSRTHTETPLHQSDETDISQGLATAVMALAVLCILMVAKGLTFDLLRSYTGVAYSNMADFALRALMPLLFYSWVSCQDGTAFAKTLIAVILFATVVVWIGAIWFLGEDASRICYTVASAAWGLMPMLLFIVLLKISYLSEHQPLFVFGIGRICYEMALIIGILFGSTIVYIVPSSDIVIFIAVCAGILLLACFFVVVGNLKNDIILMEATDTEEGQQARAFRATKEKYSLKDQEFNVLCLLYQGHSKAGIAKILMLSENTIRYYAKQLYVKLDIHSKEELINLVDSLR